MTNERCELCGCRVHRDGEYAKPNVKGRSHATRHHFIAERFFGRSKNRPGTQRDGIFVNDPWKIERKAGTFCYDCHEELLHNPVILPDDTKMLSEIFALKGLKEKYKEDNKHKIGERIKLFHEVIRRGLEIVLNEAKI